MKVRWATSWVTHIDQIETAMALPPLPCAFTLPPLLSAATDELRHATEAAKRAAALDVVATDRRLLWTDDEAVWRSGSVGRVSRSHPRQLPAKNATPMTTPREGDRSRANPQDRL
ncbi:hypothetical protein AB6N23_00100 [Cellulomonas sp. 179-A 9B4 NHS]|uniref:hypothetical protein n=1 Tax=Cellulomonas sp. 179-A 9B4 NHS TaxID=3142379 RepID=UPI0039A094BA